MQQLTFVEPETLRWVETDAPVLEGPGEALVRPVVVTTCDIDHMILHGQVPMPGPFAFGHEFVADVLSVGDGVRTVRPGDRVIVPFQISCGDCALCKRGLTASCTAVTFRSSYGLGPLGGAGWGGAFADVVRVPFADAMLLPVPAHVPATSLASASDNLVDAWRTVAPGLRDWPGADVLIVAGGARGIPLYATACALALGAARVDYIDTHPQRLATAAALGAHVIEGPPPRRAGKYHVTVDGNGTTEGLGCAVRSVLPGGICTSIAIYYQDTPMPLLEMYDRGVTIVTGRVNARGDLPAVLDLVASGRLAPERVHSEIVPWDDAIDGLLANTTKPVFVRDGA
jgi:alcohol dehydrogenase